jgi:hypothetical protein
MSEFPIGIYLTSFGAAVFVCMSEFLQKAELIDESEQSMAF